MNKIKVIAVTGIRSEYDIILPILKEINNNKNFDLKLVISGAHLSEWHGDVIGVIEKDGFNICDKIDSYISTNRNTQRIKGLGLLLLGLSQTIEREKSRLPTSNW